MTLQQAIEAVNARGDKAFVPYIMAGDGGLETITTEPFYNYKRLA